MQPLSQISPKPPGRPRRSRVALQAAVTGALLTAAVASPASADCPWVVQPYVSEASISARSGELPAYEILFDGMGEKASAFYAFSVASADLAWKLADRSSVLPELGDGVRTLKAKPTPIGTTVYQLPADTIAPETIYLVAADRPVDRLEQIGARIEPDRPVAVAVRFRGGSDQSGPLPRRTVPGFQIASAAPEQGAEVQICAYQVAMQ